MYAIPYLIMAQRRDETTLAERETSEGAQRILRSREIPDI